MSISGRGGYREGAGNRAGTKHKDSEDVGKPIAVRLSQAEAELRNQVKLENILDENGIETGETKTRFSDRQIYVAGLAALKKSLKRKSK